MTRRKKSDAAKDADYREGFEEGKREGYSLGRADGDFENPEEYAPEAEALLARVYSGENTALLRVEIEQYLVAQNALPI